MNSLRPPWIALSLIALIAILACFLRGSIAASELLWLDELHTSWSVEGTLGEVANRAADGNQTPFFFWLTWVFVTVLGHSEFSLRTVSIVAGIGTLAVACWFTWRWTHSAIATAMVAWLIAIDTQFIYYGSEARPYALLQFLSVIQVSIFCGVFWNRVPDREPNPRTVWPHWYLTLVSVLLIHTHLTSVWILVAEVIFVVTVWSADSAGLFTAKKPSVGRGDSRTRLISTAMVIVIGCLPILVQVTNVFERRGNWQSISSISQLWSDSWPTMTLLLGLPTICLVLSCVLTNQLSTLKKTSNVDVLQLERIVFVLLWSLVPIGCVVTLDYFGIAPMALERYTQVGAAGFPIFAGFCLACLSSNPGKLGLAGLIVALTAFQNPIIEMAVREQQVPQLRFENWKSPIDEINATPAKSHQPVFLFPNLIEDRDALTNDEPRFQKYLLFPVNGLYRIHNNNRIISAGPTLQPTHFNDAQIKSIKEQGGAWAIIRSASRGLVEEIGYEVRVRTATELQKQPSEIHVSIMDTPNSPVYLMSVDW